MKEFIKLALIMCTLLLFGCAQKENANTKRDLEKSMKMAEQSKMIETDLFLGFKFGMSEYEVKDHLEKLVARNKIYINDNGKYQYELTNDFGVMFYVTFVPFFHENRLYKMVYPVENSTFPTANDHIYIVSSFKNSDRAKEFDRFVTKDIIDNTVYTFVKDNLIVTFKTSVYPMMIYSDAPTDKLVIDLEKRDTERKAEESSLEF